MSAEPEDGNCAGQPLTPHEWACWVLLGNPHVRQMPLPLFNIARRIAQAVSEAVAQDREQRRLTR